VPELKHDLRSSGITLFKYGVTLGEVDLSMNYAHGNPETVALLAKRYRTLPENVFVSSEGASGQNARIIRWLAERDFEKNEAIVEYPTYEPLLRTTQEHFRKLKRLERKEKDGYRLNADTLRKIASERTGLLVLTNPHAPSGAIAYRNEIEEVMEVAKEYGFFVFCDEIYAEFDRDAIPTVFSVEQNYGIVTTSFTKAFGLGGLKLGVGLAKKELVDELYTDVLNTVGNSPNIVQLLASEILSKSMGKIGEHKRKWIRFKEETEKWLDEKGVKYFPNKTSVTYWAKLPIRDTHKWTNEYAIPRYGVAPVPGTFFLFKDDYELMRSDMVRIGIGNFNPDKPNLSEALETLGKALATYKVEAQQ
jgi:aspartate/methionine/tyrosine aminotransferase